MAKKATTKKKKSTLPGALENQYQVIAKDILRLKTDLVHGYALAKELIETKISRRNLTKSGQGTGH